jgi:5-hydroxyisourate hydrolase
MSKITTHVLDIARGKPASNVPVKLERKETTGYQEVGSGYTDEDGRLKTLVEGEIQVGIYRITFDTWSYFDQLHIEGFYPEASIVFEVRDASQHHHVPLLLSPYGYSTYRGS